MALSQRDRRAVWLGSGALTLLMVYLLAVEPLWGWYEDLVSSHQLATGRLARLIGDNRKAAHYAARVAKMEVHVGTLAEPGAYSKQISTVTERVIAVAQENNIELKGATPAAAVAWHDAPNLQRASILIDAVAEWPHPVQFVNALYHVEGIFSVEQMELSGDAKKEKKLNFKLVVSLLTKAPDQGASPWHR